MADVNVDVSGRSSLRRLLARSGGRKGWISVHGVCWEIWSGEKSVMVFPLRVIGLWIDAEDCCGMPPENLSDDWTFRLLRALLVESLVDGKGGGFSRASIAVSTLPSESSKASRRLSCDLSSKIDASIASFSSVSSS